jgi:hypothetical protein
VGLSHQPGSLPGGRPGGCLFRIWFAFCALLAVGALSFAGWLAYLLVMHFTDGGK